MHRRSIWVSDVLEGFRCFKDWLAEETPVQKAGGSGDETRSLEASAQHLCRDFLNDCCGRGLLPGARVPEYAAAVAAPVPPLRGNAAANAPRICKDFAKGYCRRGNNCNLRHVAVPDRACTHFSSTVIAGMVTHASIGIARMRSLMPMQRRSRHSIAHMGKPANGGMRRPKKLMYVTCRRRFAGSFANAVIAFEGTVASSCTCDPQG